MTFNPLIFIHYIVLCGANRRISGGVKLSDLVKVCHAPIVQTLGNKNKSIDDIRSTSHLWI